MPRYINTYYPKFRKNRDRCPGGNNPSLRKKHLRYVVDINAARAFVEDGDVKPLMSVKQNNTVYVFYRFKRYIYVTSTKIFSSGQTVFTDYIVRKGHKQWKQIVNKLDAYERKGRNL